MTQPTSRRRVSRLRRALVFTPLMMLAAGCLPQAPGKPAPPVELTVGFPTSFYKQLFEQRFQLYTKNHPGSTLKGTTPNSDLRSYDEYLNYLATHTEVGGLPDIIIDNDMTFQSLADKNVFYDFKELLRTRADPKLNDFVPAGIQALSSKDHLLALPDSIWPQMLFFNRDLFDAAGLSYPNDNWTWDDLRTSAVKLTNASKPIPVYGLGGYLDDDWYLYVLQHRAKPFDDLQHPQHLTLDDPGVAEALQFYADLIQKDQVTPPVDLLTRPERITSLFSYKQIAMLPMNMFNRVRNWGFNIGIAQLPRDRARATGGLTIGYGITRTTQNLDAAYNTVLELSNMTPIESTIAGVPARKSLATSEAFTTQLKEYGHASYSSAIDSIQPYYYSIPNQIIEAITNEIADAIKNRSDMAAAMRMAQQKIEPMWEAWLKGG